MASSRQLRIVLIRVGATDWDREGRLGGSADLPMCPAGSACVARLAQELRGRDLSAILCGPDEASTQAAAMLRSQAGGRIRSLEALREVHVGLWEGMKPADLEERYPSAFRQWRADPTTIAIPSGEPVREALARIAGELRRVLARARSERPIAILLRPLARSIAECWFRGLPLAGLWNVAASAPQAVWFTIERPGLRATEWRATGLAIAS